MRRPSLRTRLMAGFAASALLLSTSVALLSYELTRRSLLAERERTAIRVTYFDATVVQSGLASERPDIVDVLRSLDTGAIRRPVLRRDGTWYARNADAGVTSAVPESLRQLAEQGRPGVQRVRVDGHSALAVAVPLGGSTVFYEVHSLQELEKTFRTLALVLALVGGATAVAGAGAGWYVTRYVLRPLTSVATAAQEIAGGDLTARLDPATEPELARLASSFNGMVDQLSRRLERDRRFAADVSHELRSPLQTLAAAASVLAKRRAQLDMRSATAVALVTDEVARFQALVTDLLELARGDQPPERTAVDLADLARQVCRSRGLPADVVRVDGAADPTWRVDRRRFEQVLANLIDNADRHGGGAVAVRVGHAAGVRYLEVDDEGPGVSAEDREAIFYRFFRGRPANARGDSDGTGLGLALVAEHVTAHGGHVLVTDRPGGGARFRVELPERAS
ncbi:HAMP domain-containing protein [Planosporangium thailandense]|uniref:histidine kinase n=1 Tax=Planosporangium thailandense TaxID=765197 RepID=A0ABX0XYU5_9ACTN|nr:sensor histidine kinase [Planosporangium thailandense]NJC71211.1 HAMP domain-containing protein [Planosporangium thailandense]